MDSSEDLSAESAEIDIEDEEDTVIAVDCEVEGWRRLFHLPFEPIWSYSLLILATLQILLTIYEAGFKSLENNTAVIIPLNIFDINIFTDLLYFIDVLLTIGCKNIHKLCISPLEINRPNWVLLTDLVSLIPTPKDGYVNYTFYFLKCLKCFRIIHVFHYHHNMVGSSKVLLQICEYYFSMALAVMVGFVVTYNIVCANNIHCIGNLTTQEYFSYFYISLGKVTARGVSHNPENLVWMGCFSIIGHAVFLGVICTSIGYVTIALLTSLHHKYVFLSKLKLMHYDLNRYHVSPEIKKLCEGFFDNYWKKRTGYDDDPKYFLILPPALREELSLDIAWPALKHSKLFRNMDIAFLRHVSLYFKSRFMLPGTTIYAKHLPKNMMIYVVSGVIQVLSEEDDETAIISFSSGTCLGESSLVLDYNPKATLVCKTFCNLHVLEAKEFVKAFKLFPERVTFIRKSFMERLKKAKYYKSMTYQVNTLRGSVDKIEYITMMWLKTTLHRLMAKDGDSSLKHECQNIFLRDEFNEEQFTDRYFTAENLDLLAITERLELVTDSIFLKNSCPCILQPESIIVSIWEGIITILCISAGIIIPYYVFIRSVKHLWYSTFIYVITTFWWLDMYIQISTAIKLSGEILADVKHIFLYKMTTVSFLLDLFASTPLELFSSILLPKMTDHYVGMLHLNRAVKIWKLELAFRTFENKLNANVLAIRYFKYFCMFCYTIYLCSCVMYSSDCTNLSVEHYAWCVVAIAMILSGVNISSRLSKEQVYFPLYSLFTILSTTFYIFVYGALAAERTLKRANRIRLEEMIHNVIETLRSNGVSDKYHKRVIRIFHTHWNENFACKLLYNSSSISELPEHIYGVLKEVTFHKFLRNVPFFQYLPDAIIYDICYITTQIFLPPNEVVFHTGGLSDNIYIIQDGYCEVVSNLTGIRISMLSPSAHMAVLETCTGVPMVNTVITVTNCRLLCINYQSVSAILYQKYPEYREELQTALEGTQTRDELLILQQSAGFYLENVRRTATEKTKSFHKFDYNIIQDSFEEYDYYVPFDRLDLFSFVQYFLMRHTILPEGNFFFRWEIGRCICAALSSMLFPINETGTCIDCSWFFILVFLDAMAWADIYIRFHVCYYNKDGILITHPLKTAIHYLKHGFLVDLLAAFPVQLFFGKSIRYRNSYLSMLLLIRVLQMHRYIGFFAYIDEMMLLPTAVTQIVKYFPILLTLCVSVGTLMTNTTCSFSPLPPTNGTYGTDDDNNTFTEGIFCKNNTWLRNSKFKKPIDIHRVELYGIYLATTILTTSGMTGFTLNATDFAITIILLTLLAFILTSYLLSMAITQFTTADSTLLAYQNAMGGVRHFMKKYRVTVDLQQKLIAHYELKWVRKRGKDINDSICRFNTALQEDILYDVYGKILERTSLALGGNQAFLGSLLLNVSHDIHIKESCITKVNDVINVVYILYKGRVNVLAADGTKLTTLTSGSMFGNLDNCSMGRQTIEVVAVGHVEVLTINSLRFHTILNNYPRVKMKYNQLTLFHNDYLEGYGGGWEDMQKSCHSEANIPLYSKGKISTIFFKQRIFDPDITFIKIWEAIILIIVCYIELFYDLYAMAMSYYTIPMVIFQYICDVLFIINYYIKIRTAYENEVGVIVTDSDMIKKRFKQNRVLYWFTIIGMIPLDIIAWFIPKQLFISVHPILRTNRLLRFVHVISYFREQKQKLAINLYVLEFIYLIMWSALVLHFCTCTVITLSCQSSPNMHPEINCTEISTSYLKIIETYTIFSYFTISCFTHSSQELVFPESVHLISFCIIMMISLELFRVTLTAQIYSTLQMGFHSLNRYSQRLERMENFMNREQVSYSVTVRVRGYLKQLWRYQNGQLYPRLLTEAPPLLRESILNSAFGHHINNHYVFEKCHVDFNRQVIAKLKTRTYFANDCIAASGTIDKCMYFIHSGAVTVIDDTFQEIGLALLEAGLSFSIGQGLCENGPHSYTFRAAKTTTIVILCFDDWKHLLHFFPASSDMIKERYFEFDDVFV